MEIKVNDNLKMLTDSDWWAKGDVGRLVQISYNRHGRALYLVCFDSNCHKMHNRNGGHVWYVRPDACKLYRPNRLMKVE